MLRDGFVGIGDIFSGGYFTISRKSGVFDYFKKEEKKASYLTPAPELEESAKTTKDRKCLSQPRAVSFFALVCIGQFYYERHDMAKANDVTRDTDQFRRLLECSDETVSRIVTLAKSRGSEVAGNGLKDGAAVEKGCRATSQTALQSVDAELN